MTFEQFAIPDSVKAGLKKIGFEKPTEIQAKTIPTLLDGADVIGRAQTGSGKTAAFVIPLMTRIIEYGGRGLILVPTRELALQIEEVIVKIRNKHMRMGVATVIGGGSMPKQTRQLERNPEIIVATPGRLLDHVSQKTARLDKITMLVVDEADRMMDMGFMPQLKKVLQALPKNRQTILFSATFPKEVKDLAKGFMRDPKEIAVGPASKPVEAINQSVIELAQSRKNDVLLDELNARMGSVLIFTRTKFRTDRLARYLNEYGFKVGRIHGGRTLAQRRQAIDGFKSGAFRILVATDIAARGIDVAQVGHVINFDLPQSSEDYVHRIGRTGRAGATGEALSFVAPEEKRLWKAITRLIQPRENRRQ